MTARSPRPHPNRREMRLEELRLLSQMLLLGSADASVRSVLEHAARNAARLTSSTRASVAVPAGSVGLWRFAAEWDSASDEAVALGTELAAGPGTTIEAVLSSREPVQIVGDQLLADVRGPTPRLASLFRMRSLLLVPMFANDQAEGVLTVSRPKRRQKFSKHDTTLAVAIADHAALAIQAARAIERERRERLREQLLARIVLFGLQPSAPVDVARQAVPSIRVAVGADCCAAYLPGPGGRTIEAVVGDGARDPGADALAERAVGLAPHAVPLVGRALLMDAPLAITAEPALLAEAAFMFTSPEDEAVRKAWMSSEIRSWAAVPINMGDGASGILAVGRREANIFRSGDLEFLKTAGRSLGMAIGNARALARV